MIFLVLSLLSLRTGHICGRSTSTTLLLDNDDDDNETFLDGMEFLQILLQETDAATALTFLVLSLLPLRTGHVGGRSTTLLLDGDDDDSDENNETLLDGIEFLLILLREIDGDGIFKGKFLSEAQVVHAALSFFLFLFFFSTNTCYLATVLAVLYVCLLVYNTL